MSNEIVKRKRGRPPLTPEQREIRNAPRVALAKILGETASLTKTALVEVYNDKKTTAIRSAVAGCFIHAIEKGDWRYLEGVYSRVYGRPKVFTEVDITFDDPLTDALRFLNAKRSE